jgi:hypothetical protein
MPVSFTSNTSSRSARDFCVHRHGRPLRILRHLPRRRQISSTIVSDRIRYAPRCSRGVGCLSTEYRPRRPQEGVVYQVVHDHYETFRAEGAARRDRGSGMGDGGWGFGDRGAGPGGPIRGAGRGGGVAILQRFGAALNLNVHIHALVLDGVYVEDAGARWTRCADMGTCCGPS